MQIRRRASKVVLRLQVLAIASAVAARSVLAEDDIVPFDPNAPFWDGVRYLWDLLKDLI